MNNKNSITGKEARKMSAKPKKLLKRIAVTFLGTMIALALIGFIFFPRPELPAIVIDDYCTQYSIRFDTSSIEKIYFDPQGILAAPEKFLQDDQAYLLFAQHRERMNDPFHLVAWLKDIEKLTSQSVDKREQQGPFRLYSLIMTNQESFCQEVGSHVLAYLTEGTNLDVTIYLTALEGSAPAFASGGRIAFSLSHPLFMGAAWLHEPTGLTTFYNMALHELFHVGFSDSFTPPTLEQHMENEVVIDMLIALQNEGMATYVSYELNPIYPSPFEWYMYLVGQEPIVRLYINEMNELFAIAQTKPTGDAYNDIYRRIASLGYRRLGFYVVGAYMAMRIEAELGMEILVQTVSDGYEAFADTYNTVADENMKIRWKPEQ